MRPWRSPEGRETVFLAEIAGHGAGYASVRFLQALTDSVPQAELSDLFVHEEFRRRGVARALVDHVERLARERGANQLFVLTGTDNHQAQSFYRAQGLVDYAVAMRKKLKG